LLVSGNETMMRNPSPTTTMTSRCHSSRSVHEEKRQRQEDSTLKGVEKGGAETLSTPAVTERKQTRQGDAKIPKRREKWERDEAAELEAERAIVVADMKRRDVEWGRLKAGAQTQSPSSDTLALGDTDNIANDRCEG